MNPLLKNYLTYTRAQRAGLLTLLISILFVQAVYLVLDNPTEVQDPPEKQQWLSLQASVDSIKTERQQYKPTVYPFNPNFITDFKGYKLGMSTTEIDRLFAYRKTGKFVNSATEFQQVTKVSDSLLNSISPYFKFPDWVKKKQPGGFTYAKKQRTILRDINEASKEDLIQVYGIGAALSDRILKQKELLGAFVSMGQMADVWGLSAEVIENLEKSFGVLQQPQVKKIKINDASVKELALFPYFRYNLAKQIVTYRSMNGNIKSASDLVKINGFPIDKAEIIALYLEF
ncbi:MAG TPA: helix-hairpin-helix domain-containing protein [Flavobacterium sp.]|jgi:DNA uptake protein ComE-like DNA-binding protein